MKRIRNKFKKEENVRFISHLDVMRLFERAFRRADIKIAFSKGFNPHPKISFGNALMVGATTDGDYFDVEVCEDILPKDFKNKINNVLPKGIIILESFEVANEDILSSRIVAADYLIKFSTFENIHDIYDTYKKFIEQPSIEIEKDTKKGKKVIDIKAYIIETKLLFYDGKMGEIYVKLKLGEGTPTPLHLLKAFNDFLDGLINLENYKLKREKIILDTDMR